MIVYLVCATYGAGVGEGERCGWHRIGAHRFVTEDRHEVRVVTRLDEVVPLPGVTVMVRGPDYEAGPPEGDVVVRRAWFGREGLEGRRAAFEGFVASGAGCWVGDVGEVVDPGGIRREVGLGRVRDF